ASSENLTTLRGDALNKSDLLKAVQSADAVIIALGTGKNIKATTLYSDFAKLLVEIQTELNTQIPVIVLTGFGAGDSGAYNTFIMKIFFTLLLKSIYANKSIMEQIISSSKMKWEIVRPGLLTNTGLTEKYRTETSLYKGINIGAISRADVADFMVKQAENPTLLYNYVALSSK
ncbi:MAG TPA: NAD(P)H-binding protein, partial [Chitinophagales bacterium]|nr:NAD(P)H-binding protein [Chitinophagales bacterium]